LRCRLPIAKPSVRALLAAGVGLLGIIPALAQEAPREAIGPFFDIDWSVGLRGAYTSDNIDGPRYEGIVAPEVTLTRQGERDQMSLATGAELSIDQNKAVRVDDLHANAASRFALDELTELNGGLDLSLTQASPTDKSLPANTAVAPREFTGTATGGVARKLGQFDVTGTLKGQRFIEGPTTLADQSTVDNTDQSYWLGSGEMRVGYELTPLVSVFADGEYAYQAFDAASPSLGVFLNGHTTTLRGGLSYTQPGTLTADASVGRAWIDNDHAAIPDNAAWVYDASLSFTPDETLTLVGSLNTSIGPSTDDIGDTDAAYTLTGTAKYQVNPWLTLRGSAGLDRTVTLGSGDIAWGYSAGAGLDLATSRHVVWSADYLFSHDESTTDPTRNTHAVTVGVTVKK
jgi:hypothetical protein